MRLLIAIFVLSCCFAQAQRVVTYTGRQNSFKLHVDSAGDNCHVKLILVYGRNDRLQQTITPPENVFLCTLPGTLSLVQDINFDGHNDFMIPQLIPASPNIPYYYWKYNKKKHEFERDTTLEDITSPNFNADKSITSFWRSGCCTKGVSTYKYIKGDLTLVEETELSPDPDNDQQMVFTKKQLVKDKLLVTERSTQKREEETGIK